LVAAVGESIPGATSHHALPVCPNFIIELNCCATYVSNSIELVNESCAGCKVLQGFVLGSTVRFAQELVKAARHGARTRAPWNGLVSLELQSMGVHETL
jgi:hypothetical protein